MAERVLHKTIREMPAEITDDDLDAAFGALMAKANAAKARQQSGGADEVPSSIQKPKFVPSMTNVDRQTQIIDQQEAMNRSMVEWQQILAPECGVYNTKYGYIVKEFDSVIYQYIGREDKDARVYAQHNLVALLRHKYFRMVDDTSQDQIDKIVTWFCKNIYNNVCYMTINKDDPVRSSLRLDTLPPYCVAFANGVYDFKNNKFLLKYERIRIPTITNTMILYPKYCIMWCFNYDFEPLPFGVTELSFDDFCDLMKDQEPTNANLTWQLFWNMAHDLNHTATKRRLIHLSQILGYIVNTDFVQNFVILIGSGQNGKNSLLDGACSHFLLPAPGQESLDSIEEDKFIGGTLRGLSHNICLETTPGVKKTSDQLKKLTGSNEYAIEEKGKTKATIPMNCKFVFSANNRENIKFSDQTQGFNRRCNLFELYYTWDYEHSFMKYNPDYYKCDLRPEEMMRESMNNVLFVYLAMYGIMSATNGFTEPFKFSYNDWSDTYTDINTELADFFEYAFTPETLFRFWFDPTVELAENLQDITFYVTDSKAVKGVSKLNAYEEITQDYGKKSCKELATILRQYSNIVDYDQDGNEMTIREMNGIRFFEQNDLYISIDYLRSLVKLLKPQLVTDNRTFVEDFGKTFKLKKIPKIANNRQYVKARLLGRKVKFVNATR